MSEQQNKVENSNEFRELYRAIAAVQTAAIDYVRGVKPDAKKKARAKEVAEALQKGMGHLNLKWMLSGDQCWDPVTQQYVDCPETNNS